ncbi:MAG: alr [Rickettsiaceae bacterium]|jgi:alanine racemase|nr:alr [Rickettsiaceae bacterium]
MNYYPSTLEINLNNIAANYNYLSLVANSEIAVIQSRNIAKAKSQPGNSFSPSTFGAGNEIFVAGLRKNSIQKVDTAAVIKANAYGLGANEVALKLLSEGCKRFFVAHLEEAIRLRKSLAANASIFVLHGIMNNEERAFDEYNLTPVINHLGQYKIWEDYALKIGRKLDCILNFNTGMNRLEIPESEIPQIIEAIKQNNALNILYVMSHLACADDFYNDYNIIQLERFKKIKKLFPKVKASFANSSGIFLGHEYHFDLLRPGMALYGLNPCPDAGLNSPMLQVITLKTKILQIKTVTNNDTVGYGCSEKIKAGTTIATIAIGYADGYNRLLSNQGIVYINNFPAKIVGRVSMDLVTIDISSVPIKYHKVGNDVEIFGKNITPDFIASTIAGFNYEYLTSLGNRYARKYLST